jgi:hypothetical protein
MNIITDLLNTAVPMSIAIAACVLLDYWMRGLSERRRRVALHTLVQAYLQPDERL